MSKLEAGEPATQLRTLTDAFAALDLELVIRPRTKISAKPIEDLVWWPLREAACAHAANRGPILRMICGD